MNRKSSGDSSLATSLANADAWRRVGASESDKGGDGCWSAGPELLICGESIALARKLGIGRDEGAGDAWNVEPANAASAGTFGGRAFGGVLRFCFAGPGDGGANPDLERGLFPLRALGLALTDWFCGAGLFEVDFWGVAKGLPLPFGISMGNGSSDGKSLSEAYVLLAGERVDGCRVCRRRAGVAL